MNCSHWQLKRSVGREWWKKSKTENKSNTKVFTIKKSVIFYFLNKSFYFVTDELTLIT